MIKINSFLTDLKRAVDESAKTLRKNVVSEDLARRYREQRQEAQFVSEVYYNFRNNGYKSKSLFMEYSYPYVEMEGEEKRLKPDLIFESNGYDHVVEFKVFWEGDREANSSKISKRQKDTTIKKYYEKMLLYSRLKDQPIKNLYLVFTYVGPSKIENGKAFNAQEFYKSVSTYVLDMESKKKETEIPIKVIIG